MKRQISAPVIVIVAIAALVVIGFFGFRSLRGDQRIGPSPSQLYDRVGVLAKQSGGDFSRLSPDDQKLVNDMSRGHGKKFLQNQYAKLNSSGEKINESHSNP